MKKIFLLDGGAGRIIAAIPALKKYVREHPNETIRILVSGWDVLYWGIPELHDITFNPEQKGIFEQLFLDADEVISPEPYRVPGYYKQELSLAAAFNAIINNTTDHKDLEPPRLVLSKQEEFNAAKFIADVKQQQHKQKTIIIQPFGRSAERPDQNVILDTSSRSLDHQSYLKLVKKLSAKYNLVFFGEQNFQLAEDTYTIKPQADLRMWSAFIEAADYFVGCDSLGQHMARAFNKPGTVILGSTFAINTTYPDWFNIIEKEGAKKYSPIRISGLESHLADRYNDKLMDFSDEEINEIYSCIVKDIEAKTK